MGLPQCGDVGEGGAGGRQERRDCVAGYNERSEENVSPVGSK